MQLGARFQKRERNCVSSQGLGSVLFPSILFALRQADGYLSISEAASVSKKAINNRRFAPNAVKSAKVDRS